MAIQQRNADMVNLLTTDFVLRNESIYSWGSAISSFYNLEELRGLWIANADNESGIRDISGHSNSLYSPNGFTAIGRDVLSPYIELNGATQYHSFSGQQNQQDTFYISGGLSIGVKPNRIYNAYGLNRGIARVGLTVNTAPAGADLIVDILSNGASIFTTPANRARVIAGTKEGVSSIIEAPTWNKNTSLQAEIIQVGSGVAGSDLEISIGHYGGIRNLNTVNAGVTVGGWFYLDSIVNSALMGVWNSTGNNRCYKLEVIAGVPKFTVSADGITSTTVTSSETILAGQWYFIAGRFNPAVEMSVQVNDVTTNIVVGIPASLYGTYQPFEIGKIDSAYLDGKWTLGFASFNYLNDDVLAALYYNSGGMLGGLQDE